MSSDEVVEGFTRDGYEKQLRENKEKGHQCYGQPEVRYARKGSAAICYGASMMLSRDDGKSYTGVLRFTISFDAQHKASVKNVGKTKTEVEE